MEPTGDVKNGEMTLEEDKREMKEENRREERVKGDERWRMEFRRRKEEEADRWGEEQEAETK